MPATNTATAVAAPRSRDQDTDRLPARANRFAIAQRERETGEGDTNDERPRRRPGRDAKRAKLNVKPAQQESMQRGADFHGCRRAPGPVADAAGFGASIRACYRRAWAERPSVTAIVTLGTSRPLSVAARPGRHILHPRRTLHPIVTSTRGIQSGGSSSERGPRVELTDVQRNAGRTNALARR